MKAAWNRVRLDECTEIVAGATPSTTVGSYWGGDVCWATPKDLSELEGAYIADTPRKLTRAGLESCAATVLPADSVLFSSRAPIGHVAVNTVPMATNQGFKSFVPNPERVVAKFLYWWLCTNRAYLESLGNGATFKEVSKTIVSRIEIPLPPLAEQRRIAEVLDRAEALRAKRRAALAQLDSLTQSLFLDLFGDLVANERKWPVRMVKDFVAGFESGKSIVGNDEDDTTSTYRVLKVSAVTSLEFLPEQSKPMPPNYEPPASHIVRTGDLLFSRANTVELIGATAFVSAVPPNLLLPDKLWRFVWHEEPKADSHFVRFLFQQPKIRQEISQRASGTSGSMKNISQDKVLTIQTGLPPLPLQREFARRVTAVEKLKTAQRASLAELDALFASLRHRAFRGEL